MKYFSLHIYCDLEAADPLADLTIHGDKGVIVAECIMLDTFLDSLIAGFSLVDVSDHDIRVDVIDEPDALYFSTGLNEIKISYGAQFAIIGNKLLFSSELREMVIHVLYIFDNDSILKGVEVAQFAALRKFAASSK